VCASVGELGYITLINLKKSLFGMTDTLYDIPGVFITLRGFPGFPRYPRCSFGMEGWTEDEEGRKEGKGLDVSRG